MSSAVVRKPHINQLTGLVIAAAMKVHSALGPGLLESAYEACLVHELRKQGLKTESQIGLPVNYDGITIDLGYRMDLVIENSVVVELKCVEAFNAVHEAQLLSYLKLSGIHVGLLINFHVAHLRDGIKRLVVGNDWGTLVHMPR
jgi:GxxExxY protein